MGYHITLRNTAQESVGDLPGEPLVDLSSTGRPRPWRIKKMANELLAMAYDSVNPDKAARLRDCGTFLIFRVSPDGKRTLNNMSSCRVRLCPLCSWRRSLKVYANTMRIIQHLESQRPYAYIFLTLTMANVRGDKLSGALDQMLSAWNRFAMRVDVAKAVKGWYRGLEVTHNIDPHSPAYDTYHPHLHCLMAVNPSYFKNKGYLSQARWTQLWKEALKADYTPVVDVRRVKGNTAKAVAEAAKYAVKDGDFIITDDWDLTVDTVATLDVALHARRFVAYGGVMRDAKRTLALEDEETGDLVHVDGDVPLPTPEDQTVVYYWYSGYRQYFSEQ